MADSEEQPGPGADDTSPDLAEQRFAGNLREARESRGMSQYTLAREMSDRGWPWRQQTVTRIETGQRMVRLGEATAIAEILQVPLDRLMQPAGEGRDAELLAEWIKRARAAYKEIVNAATELAVTRSNLRSHPALAHGERGQSPQIWNLFEDARAVQALTPDAAIAEAYQQQDDRGSRHGTPEPAVSEEWEPPIGSDRKDRARPYVHKIQQDRRRWKMQYSAEHPGVAFEDVPEPPGSELFRDNDLDAGTWDRPGGLTALERIWLIAELRARQAATEKRGRSAGLQLV